MRILIAVCLLSACSKTGPEPKPADPPKPAKAQQPAALKSALLDLGQLDLVPREAIFVATTGPLKRTLERLGYTAFTKGLGAVYLEAAAEVTREVGRNLLDPAAWGEMGVDLGQPLGFAWLDAPGEAAMFFARLSDAAAFEKGILAFGVHAKEPFERKSIGDAVVLHPKDEQDVAVVIRGKRAAMVFSTRRREAGVRWTKRVAELPRAESMAEQKQLPADLEALGAGADAGAWVNMAAVADAFAAEVSRDRQAEWDQRSLEYARSSGDTPRVEAIEARIRTRRLQDPLAQAKRKAQSVLVRGLFAGIGNIAFGVDVDGAVLRVRARVPLTAESLPRAFLAKGKGALRLPLAFDKRPAFLGTGRVDVKHGVARIRALATAAGEARDLERAERDLREGLGIGLDDLPGLFDGEVGLALTLEPTNARGMFSFLSGIRGAGLFGTQDAKRLDTLFRAGATRVGAPIGADGRLVVPLGSEAQITSGVTGDYLAGATDLAVFDRIGTGDASASFVRAYANKALQALFARPDPAQLWAFDFGVLPMISVREARRPAANVFRDALGLTAARVEIDDTALRVDGGQFLGAKSVPAGFGAIAAYIDAMERH